MKTYLALKTFAASLVLLLLWPQLSSGQGNLVFNGGFDADASGWNVSGGYSDKGGNPGGYLLLGGFSSNIPAASQTIMGLVVGTTYVVSGDYYEQSVISTGQSFGVAIDDVYLFEPTNPGPGSIFWHNFDFFYTATASSAVLSLTSQLNGTSVPYGIDNIVMYAVPEPSASWLLFLGVGVLLYARRSGPQIRGKALEIIE